MEKHIKDVESENIFNFSEHHSKFEKKKNEISQYHFIFSLITVDVLIGDFILCEAEVSSRYPELAASIPKND